MATTVDYTGRSPDYLVFQNTTPAGVQEITTALTDAGGTSRITAGIQKIAQRFVLGLLTERGSQYHDSGYGTQFLVALKLGAVNNNSKFQIAFRNAASAILDQQNVKLTGEEPDDEVLVSASLQSFSFPSPDKLIMNVRLLSRAGESRDITLPVTLAIR